MTKTIKFTLSLFILLFVVTGCSTKKDPPKPVLSNAQNNYTTNQQCIDIIKEFEGVRLKAYTGPGGHLLIGYGHKAGVTANMTITQEQAEDYLKSDLAEVEQNVNRLVKVKLNRNQFSALVCLAYNIGWGNFGSSTLLSRLNQGDFGQAADQFLVWRMVRGKVNRHQEKRRARERALFVQ